MAMPIQQELYQKVYDIVDGPNNYDLGVGLTFPNQSRHKVHTAEFVFDRDDCSFRSWLDVLLTGLKDVGKMSEREEWEFRGILWCSELHAKRESGKIHRALVNGTYNSRTRKGKLYVLAHEQPKPLVEVISWKEMCARTNAAIAKGRKVVFERKNRSYVMYRERPTSIECFGDLLRVDSPKSWYSEGEKWLPCNHGGVAIEITKNDQLPLAFGDERILFTTGSGTCICDTVVYMSDEGVICP